MSRIRQEKRILITMDKGIADVRAYPPTDYAGIVLLRPRQTGRGAVLRFARLRVAAILEHQLDGRLLIVNERGIRIR